MALIVRRLKVIDIPQLDTLERERLKAFPSRKGWMETYHRHVERSLSEEPEGFLVAELDGKLAGGAIVRQSGKHPLTGEKHGQLLALTVSAGATPVAQRLLLESEMYLKSRGCKTLTVWMPTDASPQESELFKKDGFSVASWELERAL